MALECWVARNSQSGLRCPCWPKYTVQMRAWLQYGGSGGNCAYPGHRPVLSLPQGGLRRRPVARFNVLAAPRLCTSLAARGSPLFQKGKDMKKKQMLENLIERVLLARPDATTGTIRSFAPALQDRSDEEIEKLVNPIRARLAKAKIR